MIPLRRHWKSIPRQMMNDRISLIWGAAMLSLTLTAVAQPPFRDGKAQQRARMIQRQRMLQQGKKNVDQEAVRLLRQMAKARVNYAGEQVTERGGRIARQQVWGDARGRTRRDFLSPENMAGDIMLTSPENYRYFHKRENAQDVAFWQAGAGDELVERVGGLLQRGVVSAQRVGEEIVAGRNAAIVAVTADRLVGGSGAQLKFWIDQQTGLLLKREMSNAMGLVSRSYLTQVQIGADAVPAGTFNPPFIGSARPRPLFPKESQFATLDEARAKLPFAPVQPANLPPGFRLTGIWVFTPEAGIRRPMQTSVLLRYSDGVTTFSLDQRIARDKMRFPNPPPLRAARRPIQIWQASSGDGKSLAVVYIGHLTPQQVLSVRNSLK
jgi:hypothetical protein